MIKARAVALSGLWAVLLVGLASAQERAPANQDPQPQQNPFHPFDRPAFEAWLKDQGTSEQRLAKFRAQIEEESVAAATDSVLRELFPAYDDAVHKAEAGEPEAALALTKVLAGAKSLYLEGHLRYHLGRVFLDSDDPEAAARVFGEFLQKNRNKTPLDAEVVYFYGQSLASIPDAAEAARTFHAFLELFPNAPERYLSSAASILAELESQLDSPLHEIADVMKGVERRIRKTDTGKETQKRQKNVIDKLQKIIEEIEKLEKQAGGAPSGLGNPSSPATKSAAPPGPTRIGNLKRVSGVAKRWGMLKDRDRKAIENDLQSNLPGHYRKMLEEYYRKLGTRGSQNR